MLDSLKLVDVVEKNAEAVAKLWVVEMKKNKRTPHYHNFPQEKLEPQAVAFYRQLRELLVPPDRLEKTQEYFQQYAKNCYEEGIPLHEAIYALVLMRRHLWLYAEFQAIFITVIERHQAIDSITRIILMIDNAVYKITQYYQDLLYLELKKKS